MITHHIFQKSTQSPAPVKIVELHPRKPPHIALPAPVKVEVQSGSSHGTHVFGKIPYMNWYAHILQKFPKGSFVIRKNALFPFRDDDILRVDDIAETHWLCKDNIHGMRPKPIIASTKKGERVYLSPDDINPSSTRGLHW